MDEPERPGEARFDDAIHAWVLTRFADVSAALRDPRLSASGAADAAHREVREAASRSLGPSRLAEWRGEAEASAREFVGRLPEGVPVDLVAEFAGPWSLLLAARATGVTPDDAGRLAPIARVVFLAAAEATGNDVRPDALSAIAELAARFPGESASADVQAFVALARTLPCLLAGAWLELLRRPVEADRLRARPDLMPGAVEELARLAGPSRAVFRVALAATSIGRAAIAPGDRVVLKPSAANRDPDRFPDPDRLDVLRDASGHLAFGRGPHSCPGAPLIRLAVEVATTALLGATTAVEPIGEPEWLGGFAIRGPATLPAVLRRDRPRQAD